MQKWAMRYGLGRCLDMAARESFQCLVLLVVLLTYCVVFGCNFGISFWKENRSDKYGKSSSALASVYERNKERYAPGSHTVPFGGPKSHRAKCSENQCCIRGGTMKNEMTKCSVCNSNLFSPSKTFSKAYDRHKSSQSSKQRALNILLVGGDCILVGLQPILVYMSKVDGKFKFSPISVNFLAEAAKVLFAIVMLFLQARRQKMGEKPFLSVSTFMQAARNNLLLAVPALLYAINNYLKFVMQLYFNPATVKMLSNLKVLVIAVLLKMIMRRRFSTLQWEALALLLIGISVNQLRSLPDGTSVFALPVTTGAYIYTLIFITVPSLASVFNEYALKSQYETSIYLQNLFLYGYGAIFNFLAIVVTAIVKGPGSLDILQGHSRATILLICNNAAQGILSSFFFKYADTILKKYSSTVATIFTGIASAALFGHILTINFLLGISIVFISMHQFFSSLSRGECEFQSGMELRDPPDFHRSKEVLMNMAAGANEEIAHHTVHDDRQPLLPI